jgi:hypothetical protein
MWDRFHLVRYESCGCDSGQREQKIKFFLWPFIHQKIAAGQINLKKSS